MTSVLCTALDTMRTLPTGVRRQAEGKLGPGQLTGLISVLLQRKDLACGDEVGVVGGTRGQAGRGPQFSFSPFSSFGFLF